MTVNDILPCDFGFVFFAGASLCWCIFAIWTSWLRILATIDKTWSKTAALKLNVRYIIPFFILFCLLTIGGSSHSRYNQLDYYRTAESVQESKTSASFKKVCHYCQFLFRRNNFQQFMFSLKERHKFYNQTIENTLKTQTFLCLNGDKMRRIYSRPKNPRNLPETPTDLCKGSDLLTRFSSTCSLLHVSIDHMSNNLSFRKCINQTIRVTPFLNLSNSFLTG